MKPDFEFFEMNVATAIRQDGQPVVVMAVFDVQGFEGSVTVQIKLTTLVQFVIENETNKGYFETQPDELETLHVGTWLQEAENLKLTVQKYITDKLK